MKNLKLLALKYLKYAQAKQHQFLQYQDIKIAST